MTNRVLCQGCLQLQSHCLCAHVNSRSSETPVLVLQYNKEAQHHKNTVGLLQLTVPNTVVVTANEFGWLAEAEEYQSLLQRPYLLYPKANSQELSPVAAATTVASKLSPSEPCAPSCLVVIDASWKKSKRIFFTTTWLQQLPAVHLSSSSLQTASAYSIRKSAQAHFRSTFEASVLALSVLEDYPVTPAMQLLHAFCAMKQQDVRMHRDKLSAK